MKSHITYSYVAPKKYENEFLSNASQIFIINYN